MVVLGGFPPVELAGSLLLLLVLLPEANNFVATPALLLLVAELADVLLLAEPKAGGF
jgi:hypothetical protein